MKGYIGTYASTIENGIYVFCFDEETKQFTNLQMLSNDQNTKYLSLYKGSLAYPFSSPAARVKMLYEHQAYIAGNEGNISCFIIQDERYVYTANYHEGKVHRYLKEDAGLREADTISIQQKAGAHQVMFVQDKVLVPCLLLDAIYVYDRLTLAFQTKVTFPEGSGPRHGVLDKEHNCLYVVSEYSCEVFCVDVQAPYQIVKSLALLDGNVRGQGAAIRMSEDHRFLYVSVRGVNQIFVIDIAKWMNIQVCDSGGDHPRDIVLDPSEEYVFAVNRFSNNLVVFERDKILGFLNKITVLEHIIEGVSIVFEEGE